MSRTFNWRVSGVAALVACVWSASAQERIVPPDAIVVLDPGVDPRGEPRPILRESADGTGLDVEIPASVHIHRYYPSGPRKFQAQYFAGGPTIVSVIHPYTHQRVNVHLDLAPGYPEIEYDEDEIKYKYPQETFAIHFGRFGGVTTSYSDCAALKVRVQQKKQVVKKKAVALGDRLGVNDLAEKTYEQGRDLAGGAVNQTGEFVSRSGELFVTALNVVPGVQVLKSKAQGTATGARDHAVKRAARAQQKGEQFIPTLR